MTSKILKNNTNIHKVCDSHTNDMKIKNNIKSIKKMKAPTMRISMDSEEFYKRLIKGRVSNREVADVFSGVENSELDLYLPDNFSNEKKKKIIQIIEFYKKENQRFKDLEKMVDETNSSQPYKIKKVKISSNNNNSESNKNNNENYFNNEEINKITYFLKNLKKGSVNPLADTIKNNYNHLEINNENPDNFRSILLSKSLNINKKWNVIKIEKNNDTNSIFNENIITEQKNKNKLFFTITNVENSSELKNPLLLEKKIKLSIDKNKINEAKILRSGDLRIWFKKKKDLDEAKENITKSKNFGEKTYIKNETKEEKTIVVHRLPHEISDNEIMNSFKKSGFNVISLRTTKKIKNENKTAFVSLDSEIEQKRLCSEKKIKIGFTFYPISKYKSPDVFQCFKCFGIGHMAKNCSNEIKCLYCSEPHNRNECQNKMNPKCSLCNGKHFSNFINCPEIKNYKLNKKISYEKRKNGLDNINKKPYKPKWIRNPINVFRKPTEIKNINLNNSENNNNCNKNLENKINLLNKKFEKIEKLQIVVEQMSALLKGLLP